MVTHDNPWITPYHTHAGVHGYGYGCSKIYPGVTHLTPYLPANCISNVVLHSSYCNIFVQILNMLPDTQVDYIWTVITQHTQNIFTNIVSY